MLFWPDASTGLLGVYGVLSAAETGSGGRDAVTAVDTASTKRRPVQNNHWIIQLRKMSLLLLYKLTWYRYRFETNLYDSFGFRIGLSHPPRCIYTVGRKKKTTYSGRQLREILIDFPKFFHCYNSALNFLKNGHYTSHHTLKMLLHYLVKP